MDVGDWITVTGFSDDDKYTMDEIPKVRLISQQIWKKVERVPTKVVNSTVTVQSNVL
jgi:hypothetical protein